MLTTENPSGWKRGRSPTFYPFFFFFIRPPGSSSIHPLLWFSVCLCAVCTSVSLTGVCVWSTLDWISRYLESVQISFVPDLGTTKKKKDSVIIQHLLASSHLFYVGWEKIYISLWISCCEEPGPHSNGRMASVQTAIIDERVANARAQWWPKGPCSIYHDVWDLKEKLSVLPRRRSSRRCPPKAWTHYSNTKNPIEMPHYKHLHVKMVRENWSWSEKP